MAEKIGVYIDEDNKTIFKDLNKYLNKLKNSVIEQDKKQRIRKESIDKELLRLPKIYRLNVNYKLPNIYRLIVDKYNTERKFYLKNYEDVKDKIRWILKNGLYLFIDKKIYVFDYYKIEVLNCEKGDES